MTRKSDLEFCFQSIVSIVILHTYIQNFTTRFIIVLYYPTLNQSCLYCKNEMAKYTKRSCVSLVLQKFFAHLGW